ncbi:MAG: hypothetical protein ACXWUG_26750 [Polyangiales bacterium]
MRASVLVVLFALGCRTQKDPELPRSLPSSGESTEPSGTKEKSEDSKSGAMVEVNTKETPVMRCGPKDSYHFVVNVFTCKDGSNPYKGNLSAGHDARIGNVGANSTGHIIDLYEVPCPEGPRRVYVDMYGCPGGTSAPGGKPGSGGTSM